MMILINLGTNLDMLVWEYAMSDGDERWMYDLYTQRAGVHPTFPILIDISRQRQDMNPYLPIFNLDYHTIGQMIPDSEILNDFNESISTRNETLIDISPPGIRYFKCKGHLEQGDLCGEYKWNTSYLCKAMRGQVSWHTGWKD